MKKIVLLFLFLMTNYLLLPPIANAFCPVCTIAVGAGVGFSRWLGIDDTITGLWIGGFTVSLITWTLNWLSFKKIDFKYKVPLVSLAYFALIFLPLSWIDIIGHPLNRFLGIDKLVLGMILGSVSFWIGGMSYNKLKIRNNNRAHFPFQKVVMPVAPLVILSIIFYFLTK